MKKLLGLLALIAIASAAVAAFRRDDLKSDAERASGAALKAANSAKDKVSGGAREAQSTVGDAAADAADAAADAADAADAAPEGDGGDTTVDGDKVDAG